MEFHSIENLESQLQNTQQLQLARALTEIASRLSYNEDGKLSPEESVAANSGAEFVSSVTDTFLHVLGIDL